MSAKNFYSVRIVLVWKNIINIH